jgi:SAM-dependent methyltransferase
MENSSMDPGDTLSEYADPELYDLENQDFEPDGLFFLHFARKLNGTVLELGCGTGRVTIPLAQNNLNITGLDVVPAMIERAKQKRVIYKSNGSSMIFDTFNSNRLSAIFETGSVFQHLLCRVDQILSCQSKRASGR